MSSAYGYWWRQGGCHRHHSEDSLHALAHWIIEMHNASFNTVEFGHITRPNGTIIWRDEFVEICELGGLEMPTRQVPVL